MSSSTTSGPTIGKHGTPNASSAGTIFSRSSNKQTIKSGASTSFGSRSAVRWKTVTKKSGESKSAAEPAATGEYRGTQRRWVCCCSPRDVMYAMHKGTWWRIISVCASFVMIFFQPVVQIFDTNKGQPYIYAVYYVIAIIIGMDVALKAVSDPEYFLWYCSCCRGTTCGSKQKACCCCRITTDDLPPEDQHNKICAFGSLFFWLDVIALAAFIADFALLYTLEASVLEIDIDYDSFIEDGKINYHFYGLSVFIEVMLLIGRSAILARFFQASTVEGFMRFVNLSRLNLAHLCSCITSFCNGDGVESSRSNLAIRTLHAFDQKNILKLRTTSKDLMRSSAAIKIQRKWRNSQRSRCVNTSDLPSSTKLPVTKTSTSFDSYAGRRSKLLEITEGSRVGAALREMTAKHVAVFMMVTFLATYIFSSSQWNGDADMEIERTMVALHAQTQNSNPLFNTKAVEVARKTSVPYLYNYTFVDNTTIKFEMGMDVNNLRPKDFLMVVVNSTNGATIGYFITEENNDKESFYQIILLACVIAIWLWGVVGLVSPVMTLVVVPIERMIQLLFMLTNDPLGYQMTKNFKRFAEEEDDVVNSSWWEKEVLEGMETSFLQKTMLQIGSLMRVGFGSAGVEIIRQYLLKGSSTSKLTLNQSGSTVNCVFLFCDIRGFTDATEALQEEVFVFTNKIAYVVHSIVHANGGSANKNIGDAFLVSWRLNGDSDDPYADDVTTEEADKALYSVIKIRLALQNNSYFLDAIDATAKKRLMEKVGTQSGPVVKMGFGLHSGKAVQGAIGSQRKIDATYISEAVERSETLESLTKRYDVSMLMSDSFYNILSPDVRRRCRMIDRLKLGTDSEPDDNYCFDPISDTMTLYTYDMSTGVLQQPSGIRPSETAGSSLRQSKRLSIFSSSKVITDSLEAPSPATAASNPEAASAGNEQFKLDLSPYNPSVWTSKEMRSMRMMYTDGIFYPTFNSALEAYFNGDWIGAEAKFTSVLNRMKDGPSSYFLNIIKANAGHPFPGFDGYGDI